MQLSYHNFIYRERGASSRSEIMLQIFLIVSQPRRIEEQYECIRSIHESNNITQLLKVRCPKKLDFWGTLKVMGIEKYSLICYYIYRIEENVKYVDGEL